jgi:preprotein translocase subunit YajC
MFITPAYAQTAGAAAASNPLSSIIQFAPLVLIFIVFYFLLIRPQQKQQQTLKARLNTIKRNDKIVTAGGIIATVKKAAENSTEIEAEIAPNVTVTLLRSTVSSVLTPDTTADKV